MQLCKQFLQKCIQGNQAALSQVSSLAFSMVVQISFVCVEVTVRLWTDSKFTNKKFGIVFLA